MDRPSRARAGDVRGYASLRLRGFAALRICLVSGLLSSLAGVVLGCDGGAPEARLEAAGEDLSEALDEASELRAELAAARDRLEATEAELHEARQAVRAARKRVLSAQERVERRATDVALFREVQRRLLDAEALRDEAVMVRVDDRVVTLEGSVADEAAREAALGLAGSAPGVSEVRDRLELEAQVTGDAEVDGTPPG